jgi:nucleotide-binding universal stress UspA family protein
MTPVEMDGRNKISQKILVALDRSKNAWRAVEFIGKTFSAQSRAKFILLSIIHEPPPKFWDFGHILNVQEGRSLKKLTDQWGTGQRRQWDALFLRAQRHLVRAGIPASSIIQKVRRTDEGAAEGILAELGDARYDIVALGRRGRGTLESLLLGSVTQRVLHKAKNCAVIVVE